MCFFFPLAKAGGLKFSFLYSFFFNQWGRKIWSSFVGRILGRLIGFFLTFHTGALAGVWYIPLCSSNVHPKHMTFRNRALKHSVARTLWTDTSVCASGVAYRETDGVTAKRVFRVFTKNKLKRNQCKCDSWQFRSNNMKTSLRSVVVSTVKIDHKKLFARKQWWMMNAIVFSRHTIIQISRLNKETPTVRRSCG